MELKYEEDGFFTPGRIILFTFFSVIALLLSIINIKIILVYLFIANQTLIKTGQHNPKRKLKKKDYANWSYGD